MLIFLQDLLSHMEEQQSELEKLNAVQKEGRERYARLCRTNESCNTIVKKESFDEEEPVWDKNSVPVCESREEVQVISSSPDKTIANSKPRVQSFVWNYFDIDPCNKMQCICKICRETVIRAKKSMRPGTSRMIAHLKQVHDTVADNKILSKVTNYPISHRSIGLCNGKSTIPDMQKNKGRMNKSSLDVISSQNNLQNNMLLAEKKLMISLNPCDQLGVSNVVVSNCNDGNLIIKPANNNALAKTPQILPFRKTSDANKGNFSKKKIGHSKSSKFRKLNNNFSARNSFPWSYFLYEDKTGFAVCGICRKKVNIANGNKIIQKLKCHLVNHPKICSTTSPRYRYSTSYMKTIIRTIDNEKNISKCHSLFSKRHSIVWKYFKDSENMLVALCNICNKSISRGISYSTANLRRHLVSKHKIRLKS